MENWLIGLIAAAALVVGLIAGYLVHTTPECPICAVCPECQVTTCPEYTPCPEQTVCEVCEECKESKSCSKEVCKEILQTTPNEQLTKDNLEDKEVIKHARVQTVFLTCDEWKDRETKNERLDGDCWLGKRTIVKLEPRMNGNTCAILSTSGC